MLPAAPSPSPSENFDIECNFPRQLSSEEIADTRQRTWHEAWRVINRDFEPAGDASDADSAGQFPFGEPIIQAREESWIEAEQRRQLMRKQLQVSIRHIDQSLELDAEICGDEDAGMQGVRLPVRRVRQQGKRHAVITTRNTWGSTALEEDPELEAHLRSRFTGVDAGGNTHFDEAGYARACAEYLRLHTGANVPVLNEEDRVDIFERDGTCIGSAVVREVGGDTVRLHLLSHVHMREGCFLRKKSNRRALEMYRKYTYDYCRKLQCEGTMVDRDGKLYKWGYEDPEPKPYSRWDFDDDDYGYRSQQLTLPEEVFFGAEWNSQMTRSIQEQSWSRQFGAEDIPRAIVDDHEQCSAFALAAMGYPCSVIQGPPGTGKTTVASHLAQHFQRQGLKTLFLSHSNKGLDVLLAAARKKGVSVHRGGTEASVCDRGLQDVFIRRGLKHPRKTDFLVRVFDDQAFAQAQSDAASAGQPLPREEEFFRLELDRSAWQEAWRQFEEQKKAIIEELKREKGLVAGVTLNSLISDEIIQALDFDVVIVDEASKGFLYEMLPALQKAGKQIIFIGDHKQLGNIDIPPHLKRFLEDGKHAPEAGVPPEELIGPEDVDMFEDGPFTIMAERSGIPQVMLRTNRRALRDLVRLVSHGGYGGKLKAGRVDREDPENSGTLVWVDTSQRADKAEVPAGVSKTNPLEARLIARRLAKDYRKGSIDPENFGVITMYRAQGALVHRKARGTRVPEGVSHDAFMDTLRGNIATVDAFQGSEKDRIYLGTTRSNPHGTVGFLDDVRRVNVAASRARDVLVIYGDRETLVDNNPDPESRAYFAVAYEICRQRGAIIHAFSQVSSQATPEQQKSQSHNARRNRARRAWKRAQMAQE